MSRIPVLTAYYGFHKGNWGSVAGLEGRVGRFVKLGHSCCTVTCVSAMKAIILCMLINTSVTEVLNPWRSFTIRAKIDTCMCACRHVHRLHARVHVYIYIYACSHVRITYV